MDEDDRSFLASGLRNLGLNPTTDGMAGLLAHLDLVIEWNEKFNLTALKGSREMIVKHLLDSATVAVSCGASLRGRVLDVGTGAGYPGVVLKCLVPNIQLVLLESLSKRCRFLEEVGFIVLPMLGRNHGGYEVVWGRAEEYGQRTGYREAFDLVTARAVAHLRILAEYCLPFCRVGGHFIAMKGPAADEEVVRAEVAIHSLGGQVVRVDRTTLPEGAGERVVVVVRKVKTTPRAYPRQPGTPAKSPL